MANLAKVRCELENLMLHCAKTALDIRNSAGRELKSDGSIVTAADRAIESFLRKELPQLVPGSSVWGEEEGYCEPGPEGLWLVDPIDGTSNYSFGSPLWGVTAALVHEGEIQVGTVALPDFNEIYSAHRGGGATCNQVELPPIPPGPIRDEELVSYCDQFSRHYGHDATPGKMRYTGAFVAEGTWVARQRFRGMISDKANLYDAAGVIAICRELGADVRYADGGELDLDAIIANRRIDRPFIIFPANSGWILSERIIR